MGVEWGGAGCVYHCVVSVWVYVTGAVCVFVFFWVRGIVRRQSRCAVARRSTLSLRQTTQLRVPVPLSPGWLPETQLSTCGDAVVQTDTLSCCRDKSPPKHLVSEVPSGRRYGQSRTPHHCAMPTILSQLRV